MRAALFAGCLLASASAWGQGLPFPGDQMHSVSADPAKVTLSLPVGSAMLIVQTLKQIECRNVASWATCELAVELLKNIQSQVRAQQK